MRATEVAWAAGFFDGEGSTIARLDPGGRRAPRLLLSVGQAGTGTAPAVLLRSQAAVGGLGRVTPRPSNRMYAWRAGRMKPRRRFAASGRISARPSARRPAGRSVTSG